MARTVIRRVDEVAKGLDASGALQRYALRSSHLEAREFRIEICNDAGSSAVKIDCGQMPRFQRCLAQAYEFARIARLAIDQQCRRRVAFSNGITLTVPFVNGCFASSPALPSDELHSGASRDEPGRPHASRTDRLVASSSGPARTAERQPRDRGNPVPRMIASDVAVPLCLLTGQSC